MRFPVSRRYRHLVFAVIMSLVTALIVSGVITASHAGLDDQYFDHWVKGFFMVWPIVFIVILVIAPLVSRFVDAIAENWNTGSRSRSRRLKKTLGEMTMRVELQREATRS